MATPRNWRTPALLAACLLPFLGFWTTGLTDLDEGFYGAVVANMLRTGDWITPYFNGEPWFEKPILAYWLAAPSVALFGEDLGPRLPSVLCTLATALVLFRFARRHFGQETARIAAAAYCGSVLVVGVGRMMLTDAPFVLALVIALTSFYESVTGQPKKRILTAAALGFAVLAKGPVAGLLFLLIAGITAWRMPDLRPNFKGHWLTGFALFAAIVAAWYVPAYLANGDLFVQKFLIEQNLGRFSGGDLAHRTPALWIPFYFPIVLFLALMPWSWWAVRAKWFQWPTDSASRYLWIWAFTVLVFFSLSLTKLPHYILPAVAPLVVVTVSAVLQRRKDATDADTWLKCALVWSVAVFALASMIFRLDYDMRFAEVHRVAKFLRAKDGYVVLFDVGRRERDTEMKLALNQSANPSFLFYLRKEGKMSDNIEDVTDRDGTVWIVTEQGELTADLIQTLGLAGFNTTRVRLPFESEKFEVWRAEPLGPDDLATPLQEQSVAPDAP